MAEITESSVPKSDTVKFWLKHIDAYEKKFGPWEKQGKKINKRYMSEADAGRKKVAKFNTLWSNVQTLAPAIYDKQPKPNIERRNVDKDPLGLATSDILERSVTYFIETDDFNDKIKQCVLDRLLPGRGAAWIRYVPTIEKVPSETPEISVETPNDDTQITDDVTEQLKYEDVEIDYVHWTDFGHTFGRTWQEVRAGWRRVFMDRSDLVKRFGDKIGNAVPLNAKSPDAEKEETPDKAEVYEIWDKKGKTATWINRDSPEVLGEEDDPLKLKDFFPFPKPLYATLSNDNLIPTADYVQYFDQARELDVLTGRIDLILQALRVAGVYDAAAEGVQRLLSEEVENKLIPVQNWAVFGEKGGLNGVVNWFPVEQLVKVLTALYEARDKVKQDMYEITGISDIVRGATNPNETLGAQELKGQYATLRLGNMQKDVARFCRDLVRLSAEVIAGQFSIETIKQISGVKLLTEQEKAQITQQQQMAQQQAAMQAQPGQPPAPPQPLPDEIQDLLDKPTWEQVEQLLRDDMARCFRISIETDSTIKADQENEKQARTEMLTATGGFIREAAQIQSPALQPLLMDMLMFGVRGFKVGRELEGSFERAKKEIDKVAKQPPPQPPPDPAIIKAQADMQMQQGQMQIEVAKAQSDAQLQKMQIQMKGVDLQIKGIDLQIEQLRLQQAMAPKPEVAA